MCQSYCKCLANCTKPTMFTSLNVNHTACAWRTVQNACSLHWVSIILQALGELYKLYHVHFTECQSCALSRLTISNTFDARCCVISDVSHVLYLLQITVHKNTQMAFSIKGQGHMKPKAKHMIMRLIFSSERWHTRTVNFIIVMLSLSLYYALDNLCFTFTGLDNLPCWFLRLAAPLLCIALTYLFNLSLGASVHCRNPVKTGSDQTGSQSLCSESANWLPSNLCYISLDSHCSQAVHLSSSPQTTSNSVLCRP